MTQQTPLIPRPAPEFPDWRERARCADLPVAAVFSRTAAEARPVLRACNACPVIESCLRTVDPANTWFDGVCGGRLWSNGREVPLS
ncbi:WhiB family transcriptional regulator [Streptomyces sp. NPDC017529]|uniref:WhiB family transcriptional regulator n=1 Tax=Streptomyces sp. NPDC017529 TaxID=3365000 RepID=UPI0037B76F0E